MSRAPPAAGCWRRCGCITLPAAAPGPRWRTESPPPPAYGSRCRFPDGREIRCCNPCSCRHLKLFEAVNVSLPSGRSHLELLYRRHVVAEHALLQHGDGVALTADLLNLLAGTVAAGGQTKLLRKITTPPGSGKSRLRKVTHLTPGSLMLCPW